MLNAAKTVPTVSAILALQSNVGEHTLFTSSAACRCSDSWCGARRLSVGANDDPTRHYGRSWARAHTLHVSIGEAEINIVRGRKVPNRRLNGGFKGAHRAIQAGNQRPR
jgi:hypothetical protein